MGTLRCGVSEGPMSVEHDRILRGMLARKDESPELQPGERLEGEYHPRAIEISAINWRVRMVHEHRSAQTFANLLPLLNEAEAPLDFKTVVLRSAIDELRHAGLCANVLTLLGADPHAAADLTPEPPTLHEGLPPLEQALRNVVFVGCISETVAVGMLTEERDMTEEPFIRRALTQLLSDETLHARVGWAYLHDVWPQLDAAARSRTNDYVGRALGYYERCILESALPGNFSDEVLADARRLGFSEPRNARELAYQTVEEVILPELAALGLDVREAWEQRVCTP